MEYDNGELETIEVTRAEPDEGFNPPSVGTTICVKSRGGKYSAQIKEVTEVCTCVLEDEYY